MVTPALTKQQQKKALSGKKGGQRVLRNVLSLPYETYWPLLQEKEEEFKRTLESVLAPLRIPRSLPLHKVQHLSWEEVKKARKVLRDIPPEKKALRDLLLMGINSVSKALEKGGVCCVLLTNDTEPKDLARHVVVMCANRKVPVLVVASLSSIIRTHLGFSSIALGFKSCVAENKDSHFHDLYQTIRELSAEFPVPQPYTYSDELDSKPSQSEKVSSDPPRPPSSIYLYRASTKERAFVPGQVAAPESDFLALSPASSESSVNLPESVGISHKWSREQPACKPQYITPVIKRLQPNPNKKRKKKNKN
ncbi:ribonuclease P protein subunit p38 [Anabrus simplex]|uniref:ribonuclease P protein subunit p38 n=1 Tax=Anabrus simplex TaxID=316456 RepID=UPI0035A2FE1B